MPNENYTDFNHSGKLAALLGLIKYSVSFSWDKREKSLDFLKLLLGIFEKDKNFQ
jgi:hypothetical protein